MKHPQPTIPPAHNRAVFLTAQWRHLAMLNYDVEPSLLAPFVAPGTELDFWCGKAFVSVVGFLFLNTCVHGIPIPFHRNFEEVNLRFYVRRKADDGWRRGVVFIKELVPRRAIAWTAKVFYNENYAAVPMSHRIEMSPADVKSVVYYSWRFGGRDNSLTLIGRVGAQMLREGSEQEFITEHYWGYSAQRDGSTLEYHVEHPRWSVWESKEATLDCDIGGLYGRQFEQAMNRAPASAFLAEGSEVKVYKGLRLRA